MSIDISSHNSICIKAEHAGQGGSEWVDLVLCNHRGESRVTVFFTEPGLAKRYADAINAVEHAPVNETSEAANSEALASLLHDDTVPF